jgi:hypothetical protein
MRCATQVLGLVCKYEPLDEEETFTLMNLLDPVLRTSNSGVVLATVKCFLHLTDGMLDLKPQVRAPSLSFPHANAPLAMLCHCPEPPPR